MNLISKDASKDIAAVVQRIGVHAMIVICDGERPPDNMVHAFSDGCKDDIRRNMGNRSEEMPITYANMRYMMIAWLKRILAIVDTEPTEAP
jgi:hypothetical protein